MWLGEMNVHYSVTDTNGKLMLMGADSCHVQAFFLPRVQVE